MASSANKPPNVVTKTLPKATAGVEPISFFPVSRSHRTPIRFGADDPASPEFDRSFRNSVAGHRSSGVGTGVRSAYGGVVVNDGSLREITSPFRAVKLEIH